MSDMVAFIQAILASVADFLLMEPIIYLVMLCFLCVLIKGLTMFMHLR